MKKIILLIIVLAVLVAAGAYFYFTQPSNSTGTNTVPTLPGGMGSGEVEESSTEEGPTTVLGTSVEGRAITAYNYGSGDTRLLFVGGIHGGYEYNTTLVAYEMMDYLEANPSVIPANVTVSIIPVLNPDGLASVVQKEGRFTLSDVPNDQSATVPGRFNANGVDLNRNFACDWQSTGTWQSQEVDGGTSAFSEPESAAMRDYIAAYRPAAVVAWYSAANGVFASNCHEDILPETLAITNAYADASGYPAYETYDFYEITGDMMNWLARENIPAISVLMKTHTEVEADMNRKGLEALLSYYAR